MSFYEALVGSTPNLPENNGLDSVSTADGLSIRIVTQTKASIKKGSDNGASAKQQIGKWLREHDADYLIKSECVVPASQKEKLQQTGIIFQEKMDINTNSLKAFLCDQLGQKGNPATISMQDLPDGLSFYQWDEAIAE